MCEDYGFRWGAFQIGGPAMPVLLAVVFCACAIGRIVAVCDSGPEMHW